MLPRGQCPESWSVTILATGGRDVELISSSRRDLRRISQETVLFVVIKVGVDLLFICMNACFFGSEHRLELKSHVAAFRLNLGFLANIRAFFVAFSDWAGLGWELPGVLCLQCHDERRCID